MTYPNVYANQTGPLALSGLDANFLNAVDISNGALSANATGSSDAITATYTPAPAALVNGLTLYVRAASANTTTTPQFSPNGLTGHTIVKGANLALVAGDILGAGHWLQLTYDASNLVWVLANPANGIVQAKGFGFHNRIINGGFILNQRVYVSGTSLASGTYGHDRWKGGASAGTYTFTQGSLGVNTTITITAGSIIQVIEGCNLAEGGTYVLSWTGTAQGRLNGGSYGASGTVTVTGWVAGTNLNVEFNTGTCGNIQLEIGSTATSFDYRDYGRELILCQRYYQILGAGCSGGVDTATSINLSGTFKTPMRATPSALLLTTTVQIRINNITPTSSGSGILAAYWDVNGTCLDINGFSGLAVGQCGVTLAGNWASLSAEL